MISANPATGNLLFPKRDFYEASKYCNACFRDILDAQTRLSKGSVDKALFEKVGVNIGEEKAVDRAKDFYARMQGKVVAIPSDTPGVLFIYPSDDEGEKTGRPIAVFKMGEQRAERGAAIYRVADSLGFSEQYAESYIGCLANPYIRKSDTPDSEQEGPEIPLWNGLYKYPELSTFREGTFILGELMPFIEGAEGFGDSERSFILSMVAAAALGTRDVQVKQKDDDKTCGNVIAGKNTDAEESLLNAVRSNLAKSSELSRSVESVFSKSSEIESLTRTPSTTREVTTPSGFDSGCQVSQEVKKLTLPLTYLPCLEDSKFTHKIISNEVRQELRRIAEGWDIKAICLKAREQTADYYDSESEKRGIRAGDTDSEFESSEAFQPDSNQSSESEPESSNADSYNATPAETPKRKRLSAVSTDLSSESEPESSNADSYNATPAETPRRKRLSAVSTDSSQPSSRTTFSSRTSKGSVGESEGKTFPDDVSSSAFLGGIGVKDHGGVFCDIEEVEKDSLFPPRNIAKENKIFTEEQIAALEERLVKLKEILAMARPLSILDILYYVDPDYQINVKGWEEIEITKGLAEAVAFKIARQSDEPTDIEKSKIVSSLKEVSISSLRNKFNACFEEDFNEFANSYVFNTIKESVNELYKKDIETEFGDMSLFETGLDFRRDFEDFLDAVKERFPLVDFMKLLCRVHPCTVAGRYELDLKRCPRTASTLFVEPETPTSFRI